MSTLAEKCYQILFPCSGNSARSILAEVILNPKRVDEAFRNGVVYIVVGRPIRDARDARAIAEKI